MLLAFLLLSEIRTTRILCVPRICGDDPEYDLEGGRRRFDPDYFIARSWQRLRDGKGIQPHDLTLLRHESYEYTMMQAGIDYGEAHRLAEKRHNYGKELCEWMEGSGYRA